MKILFLDMDGVVNTASKDRYSLSLKLTYDYNNYKDIFQFDPRILINFIKLLRFCKENDIGICITSTWRINTTKEGWNDFIYRHFSNTLKIKETDTLIVGTTGLEQNGIRGLQIAHWLDKLNNKDCKFLVVDDEINDIEYYLPDNNILKIDFHYGLTEDKLQDIFNYFRPDEKIERKIYVNGIYKHFKGNKYKVLNIAEHTETGDKMVVYQALYGENKIYVRPYNMFISKVDIEKYPNAKQKYRFELSVCIFKKIK